MYKNIKTFPPIFHTASNKNLGIGVGDGKVGGPWLYAHSSLTSGKRLRAGALQRHLSSFTILDCLALYAAHVLV